MVGAAPVGGGDFYTGLEWVGPCIGINWIVAMATALCGR